MINKNLILECTKFPILYEKYKFKIEKSRKQRYYDPVLITLEKIKKEYSYD